MDRFIVAGVVLSLLGCDPGLTVKAVSDYGGSPVAGVRLKIDDGEWISTDAEGQATFRGVEPPFVLHTHQTVTRPNPNRLGLHHADVFLDIQSPEGSTVVLRVDGSALARHSSMVSGSVTGGTGGPVTLFLGGDSRWAAPNDVVQADGRFTTGVSLERPGSFDSVLRVLETDGASPPGHYAGYGEAAVRLVDPAGGGEPPAGVTVNLAPVGEGIVAGTATPPPSMAVSSVYLDPFLRFPDGDVRPMGDYFPSGPFSTVFPRIPTSEAFLLAEVRGGNHASSVHQRKVSVPSTDVTFDLPEPVQLVEPAPGATIGADTVFRWTGGPTGGQTMLSLLCEGWDSSGDWRVVSASIGEITGTEASLPRLEGVAIDPAASCSWTVTWYPSDSNALTSPYFTTAAEVRFSVSERRAATFR